MNQTSSRRRIAGFLLATLGTAALVAVLLPFRDDITPLSNGFVFLALVFGFPIPLLLAAIRFFRPEEVARMRMLLARLRPATSG